MTLDSGLLICVAAGDPADPCTRPEVKRPRRDYCKKHYTRIRRAGLVTPRVPIDNLTRYTVDEDGCWMWAGPIAPNGYGTTSKRIHGTTYAHRAFWMEYRGPLPTRKRRGPIAAVELDHLCRKRACVNPWTCLEPVPRAVNMARGARGLALTGQCYRGLHDIAEPDALIVRVRSDGRTHRECRVCRLAMRRVYWARQHGLVVRPWDAAIAAIPGRANA